MNESQAPGPIGLDYVNHVSIAVTDLECSLRFYTALTGIEPAPASEEVAGAGLERASATRELAMRYATLPLRNLELNLIEFHAPDAYPAPQPRQRPGTMHLCLRTADLSDTVSRMRSAGFEFVADPYSVPPAEGSQGAVGMRFVYFDDPDGNHLELIERGG